MTDLADAKERLCWSLAEPLLDGPGVSRGTMMGFPCLRYRGRFFAAIERESKDLIVKLPADRVLVLIASGRGTVFAPNHRAFREWVAVPKPDRVGWAALLDEAHDLARIGPPSS